MSMTERPNLHGSDLDASPFGLSAGTYEAAETAADRLATTEARPFTVAMNRTTNRFEVMERHLVDEYVTRFDADVCYQADAPNPLNTPPEAAP